MLTVGLTGGIGTGKSTLARFLGVRGAEVIDADAIGRLALEPGEHAWRAVVNQFGNEILVPSSMEIDRRKLADIVFNDRNKLVVLNQIVHPVIVSGVADWLETLQGTEAIVVIDAALIVEIGLHENVDVLVVVSADREVRERRVMAGRSMTVAEVRARMAAQEEPEQLIAKADIVVVNNGTLAELEQEADSLWSRLQVWEGRRPKEAR
jgi:dephospho-CoA kinase